MLSSALLFSLSGSILCLQLTPPQDVNWVREEQSDVSLVCQASTKIHSCSWTTPYGEQYPLESNLKAEGGRLEHFANDKDVDCGIKINSIEARDNGMWQCNVGVVENNEVRVENGSATITIADPEPPTKLRLETPYDMVTSNFSEGVVNKVSCTALESRPAPTFSWTVEGETVTAYTENVFDEEALVFTQVLHFTPTADQANKTLTCSIIHPGLSEAMISTTGIRLSSGGLLSVGLGPGYIALIVILAVAGLIIIGAVMVAAKMKMKRSATLTTNDEEKGAEDSAVPENEEKEKTEERKRMNLQDKVVKILTALKPKEKKAADDVPATEFEKIDLTEVDESKQEETEEEQPAAEKKTFGEKINNLLSKLRPKPTEKKVETEETETKEEVEPEEKVELDQEPTEDSKPQKRRGSETSV